MENTLIAQENGVATNSKTVEDFRKKLQGLTDLLNRKPNPYEIKKTPDGKANSIPISFIEMSLDEIFFGLWETDNFKWNVVANEIVGSIDLIVTHPITGKVMKRVGAAAIQIMVDKAPENLVGSDRNKWALNLENKKPNALDMGFPKLKAECLKNAAQSLGKLFGRDLNRKDTDEYNPLIQEPVLIEELQALYDEKKARIPSESVEDIERIINSKEEPNYKKLHKYLKSL